MRAGEDGAVRVERHPAGYDYRARFPRVAEVLGGELGAVYTADGPEGPALVSDEFGLAELLPEGDGAALVTVRLYASAAARDAAAATFAAGDPGAGPGATPPGA